MREIDVSDETTDRGEWKRKHAPLAPSKLKKKADDKTSRNKAKIFFIGNLRPH
jgi:hypothetical protein